MCKPILPFIEDELAHLFWKAKHLATVHHHHGDHHAEEEIAKAPPWLNDLMQINKASCRVIKA